MTSVEWDPKVRDFLRKLPKDISQRIFNKVDWEICKDVERFLETLVNFEGYKIRIGDYLRKPVSCSMNRSSLTTQRTDVL